VTVTGVTNGATYTCNVRATNSVGTGPASAASNSVMPQGAPGAPTIGTATAGNALINVAFTPPASNGGSAILDYTATCTSGTTGAVTPKGATGTTSPITVTGVTNGATYSCSVQARNANGSGPASGTSNSVVPKTVPGAPTAPAATPGNTTATVHWTAPASTGGSAITGYVVTPFKAGVAQPAQTFNTAAVSDVVTGLTNGTAYTFKIAAKNAVGTGAQSVATAAVTPRTVPGAPTAPAATAGNGTATVHWTAPASTGGSAITGYVVTPFKAGVAQPAQTFNTAAVSDVVSGLTNGSSYTFKVAAKNVAGTGVQSVATTALVVGTPVAPATPNATPGNATATVTWVAPANNGSAITGYVVTPFKAGVAQPAQTFNTTATSHVITGLTNGSSYTFKVAAKNARGTGVQSVASAAIVVGAPLAPTAPGATAGHQQATVHWTAPASNGGSAITGYVITPYIGTVAQTPIVTGVVTSRVVTGLTTGTHYTFKIAAKNVRGTGPQSVATAVVTPT
jgi:titin